MREVPHLSSHAPHLTSSASYSYALYITPPELVEMASSSTKRMPRLELTDYDSLAMGHDFSMKEVSILGLDLQVFGLEEIRDSEKPIVAVVSTRSPRSATRRSG